MLATPLLLQHGPGFLPAFFVGRNTWRSCSNWTAFTYIVRRCREVRDKASSKRKEKMEAEAKNKNVTNE